MSDGPHRSLPMRQAWKRLAEHADNPAADMEKLIQLGGYALEDDLREEFPDRLLRQIQSLLIDQQLDLWDIEKIENLKSGIAAGYPFATAFIDHVIRLWDNKLGDRKVENALCEALYDRFASSIRQMEEHYLRKSYRCDRVINRLKEARGKLPITEIARNHLAGIRRSRPSDKMTGIDDGIRL